MKLFPLSSPYKLQLLQLTSPAMRNYLSHNVTTVTRGHNVIEKTPTRPVPSPSITHSIITSRFRSYLRQLSVILERLIRLSTSKKRGCTGSAFNCFAVMKNQLCLRKHQLIRCIQERSLPDNSRKDMARSALKRRLQGRLC